MNANDGNCYVCKKRINKDVNANELYCNGIIRAVCPICYELARIKSDNKRMMMKYGRRI
jgi:hypothetical protein